MLGLIKEEENHILITVNLAEANLDSSDLFKQQVVELLDSHKKAVVINLTQVEYIDSSFLGALVSVLKHAIAMKLDIILVGMHKDVHSLFLLIRLDKVFKIYQNYEEALIYM